MVSKNVKRKQALPVLQVDVHVHHSGRPLVKLPNNTINIIGDELLLNFGVKFQR